jgi:hypothetical protein
MGRSVCHWLRVGLLSGALGCMAIGIASTSVGAAQSGVVVSSPIKVGDSCTTYTTGQVVGKVVLIRVGSRITARVALNDAIPDSTYTVYLYGGPSHETDCRGLVDFGGLHTNVQGDASTYYVTTLTPAARSDTWFFLALNNHTTYLEDGTYWNESALFDMP